MSQKIINRRAFITTAGLTAGGTTLLASSPKAAAGPSSDVEYTLEGAGGVLRTVQERLSERVSVKDFGAVGNGDVNDDDGTAIQSALDFVANKGGGTVWFPDGDYKLTDLLTITSSNVCIQLSSGVMLEQTGGDEAYGKGIFRAYSPLGNAEPLSNVWIIANGALLFGKGLWNFSTSNSYKDRVVQFINCVNSGIDSAIIKNAANAGVFIEACRNIRCTNLIIEGTHTHGRPIESPDPDREPNFQSGIFIQHSQENGNSNDIFCTFDISGTAQGVLVESHESYDGGGENIKLNGLIHDIPGQHGIYTQSGGVSVDITARNIALSACKLQVKESFHLKNFNIKINANNIGSHAFEIQNGSDIINELSGTISNVIADITASNVGRGVVINNCVKNVKIRAVIENSSQYGCFIKGQYLDGIDMDITTNKSNRHGVLIDAPGCKNISIRARVREAGISESIYDGIRIKRAGDIILYDPDVSCVSSNMQYGLYVLPAVDSKIKVRGSARLIGAKRASAITNIVLEEWPEEIELDGRTADSLVNYENFTKSSGHVVTSLQTDSTSYKYLWQKSLPDDTTILISADIVAKSSSSSARRCVKTAVLCYRENGGDVVIIDEPNSVLLDTASPEFNGKYYWEAAGSKIRIRCHSGSGDVYEWKSRVSYVDV